MALFQSLRLILFEGLLARIVRLSARLGRSARSASHLALGRRGEATALFYLRRLGFTVVARRWQSCRYTRDLDLIAWEGDSLCFIEVKTGRSREVATAEAAVDEHKRCTLRRIARHYLRQAGLQFITPFDVLSIYFEQEPPPEFELFRAFDWS